VAPPTASETFGKYRLVEPIAVGQVTEILKARLDGIGGFHRTFALKRVRPGIPGSQSQADQLVEEARIAGLLSHANVVQIMDLGRVDSAYYVAMEYADGPDLGRVLARCRQKGIRLPVPHAVFIALELLKALDYTHARQVMRGGRAEPLDIVHQAVSPENIITSFQGEVKLTDFGHAKARNRVLAADAPRGAVADYSSPELVGSGPPIDQRSDLFSLGVVLYEMLTGSHPFRRRSEAETRSALRAARFTPAHAVQADVPESLSRVVSRALARDPGLRPGTAATMKEALDGFLHDAGFVFGPAGLSTFLRQLFPTEEPLPLRPATGAVLAPREASDRGPITNPMVGVDDERPTTVEPKAASRVVVGGGGRPPRAVLGDLSRSRAFGPLATPKDESTLIKRISIPDDPSEWGDAPTRIRNASDLDGAGAEDDSVDLLLPAPEEDTGRPTLARPVPRKTPWAPASPASPAPGQAAAPAARSARSYPPPRRPAAAPIQGASAPARPALARPAAPQGRPPVAPRTPQTAAPQTAAPQTAPAPSRGIPAVLYLGFGALVVMVVLVVGLLVGARLASFFSPEPALPSPPELHVSAPAGTRITVDGEKVTASAARRLELEPGLHTVKATMPGGDPVQVEVELAEHDIRMLHFQSEPIAQEPR
jgi:serine/threonine protein kinase